MRWPLALALALVLALALLAAVFIAETPLEPVDLQELPPSPLSTSVPLFATHYQAMCSRKYNQMQLVNHAVWDQAKLCAQRWTSMLELGSFASDDFKLRPPKHAHKGNISDPPSSSNYVPIPHELCVFETSGYFDSNGLLFDCTAQYPLLMPRHRRDLKNALDERSPAPPPGSRVRVAPHSAPRVLSLLAPFNDRFGRRSSAVRHHACLGAVVYGLRSRQSSGSSTRGRKQLDDAYERLKRELSK